MRAGEAVDGVRAWQFSRGKLRLREDDDETGMGMQGGHEKRPRNLAERSGASF